MWASMSVGESGLPTAGATVSHYRVLSALGVGGMGAVYLAEDSSSSAKVALKFLKKTGDAHGVSRLLREAETASALDHPNIATIYEIGEWNGQPFIAMAFVPGETLLQRLRRGPMTIDEINSPEDGFLVHAGRALVLPILRGTYERSSPAFRSITPRTSAAFRDHVIYWFKDIARTVDYLQTRRDIATDKLAYLGRSRGAALGPVMLSIERRFKAAVFCIPGFYEDRLLPEIDVVNYAPRMTTPGSC